MNQFLSQCVGAGKIAGFYTFATVLGLGAFGLTTSRAQTQVDASRAEPTYSVQRTYKAGDVDHYKVNVHTVANGPKTGGMDVSISISTLMKETTKAITPEGTTTIIDEYEQANSDVNGQHVEMTAMMPKVIQVRDKTGHTDVKTEGGNPQMATQGVKMTQAVSGFQIVFLPIKPVKVGDTWTADGSSLAADPTAKSLFTVKLESVEILNGIKVLHLKAVADITGGSMPDTKMHDEITLSINAQTGKALKMISKTDGASSGTKITAVMTIDLTEASDKKDAGKDSNAKKGLGAKP